MEMDDVAHPANGSQIDIAGYRACRNEWCSELVLVEVARRTTGLCSTCFATNIGQQVGAVEVISRGQRQKVQTRVPKPADRAKGDRRTKVATEKARLRAMKRLRAVFPDLYDIFYAEERARCGLDPWPIEMALRPGPDPDGSKTMDFARVYHALDQNGVPLHGLEDQPEDADPRRQR